MDTDLLSELLGFIDIATSPFHAVALIKDILLSSGFSEYNGREDTALIPGRNYFITKNDSSVIAFKLPENLKGGFMIAASHCDSPCFKIKDNGEIAGENYKRLSVERYGGMLLSTWLDRPLSIAGRAVLKVPGGIRSQLFDLQKPECIIPSLAIHMNREANDKASFNPAKDTVPLYCGDKGSVKRDIADSLGLAPETILAYDAFVYNMQPGVVTETLLSAPRLDDLQCAYTSFKAFMSAENSRAIPVFACFDNEEVGSETKQGAGSMFLADTLTAVAAVYGKRLSALLPDSFMLSCDNAHAVHPNYPEKADSNHSVYLNKGIAIKQNSNMRYASDGISIALMKEICARACVPYQVFANRADLPGGSTLGTIADTLLPVNTVDIGLPQLAMHSSYETSGVKDAEYMIRAVFEFFSLCLSSGPDGFLGIE
ncbi:MAG: M18 family aminopeptidase [Oscillospiraceae bacterium]|nr:M18 family aminopeptidase [Oscillospiraceae bacterium]